MTKEKGNCLKSNIRSLWYNLIFNGSKRGMLMRLLSDFGSSRRFEGYDRETARNLKPSSRDVKLSYPDPA